MRELDLPGAAAVQVMSRFGLTLASRGPIWRAPTGPNDSTILRRSGLHMINSEGHDLAALRSAGYRQMHTAGSVAELSLASTNSARLAAMKPKWRNTLRRAQSTGLRIKRERFAPHRHEWLLAADLKQQRAKGFRSLPHAVLKAYAEASPRDAMVFVGHAGRHPISAMLFLVHGSVATYHMGWSGDAGRKRGAHHALLAEACSYLAMRGVIRLDLGSVDTVNAPGLARFKIGTGAVVRPLGGSWLRVPWL